MSRKKRSGRGRKGHRPSSARPQEAGHRNERDQRDRRPQETPRRDELQEAARQSRRAEIGPGWLARNWPNLVAAAIIIAAGAAAYSNSFEGVYIFDDTTSIPKNPHIKSLWPIWEAMKAPSQQTADGRPILCLSLAINYAISELEVWSWHLVNLLIHLGCGLLLYGIIRRTLLTDKLAGTCGRAAWPLALICTVIWLLHPLNTGSVTYIIQRAESLMGLFYLATLYLAIRGLTSPTDEAHWWVAGAVITCGIGMACKEVMFTAPMIVLIYDLIFIARKPSEPFRQRRLFYLGLAATWGILALLVAKGPRHESVGFSFGDLSAWDYAVTQCNVIIHYLKLCFWPAALSLDYDWPIARKFAKYAANGIVLLVILTAVIIVLVRRPRWGFLGVWIFLILGPTSSFLPIATEVAAEHRMYLPLIGVVVAAVCGAYVLGRWLTESNASLRRPAIAGGILLAVSLSAALGVVTYRRNFDYLTRERIWRDVTRKEPKNARGHHNLGIALADADRHSEAIKYYDEAIRLRRGYVAAIAHRGTTYNKLGQHERAMADFELALSIDPNNTKAQIGRGVSAEALGRVDEAIDRFAEAAAANPDSAIAWSNLGSGYDRMGKYDKAIEYCSKAIEIDPTFVGAWQNRGVAYAHNEDYAKAVEDYSKALELDPGHAETYNNRGSSRKALGQFDEALADLDKALQLKNDLVSAYIARGSLYVEMKKYPQAVVDLLRAVEAEPDNVALYGKLAIAYRDSGNFAEAEKHFARSLELKADDANTYNDRGISRGKSGNYDLAIQDFTRAIELDPGHSLAYNNRGMAWGNLKQYDKAVADFGKAVELDPQFVTAYWHKALARDGLGDSQGAIADMRTALRLARDKNQQQLAATIQERLRAYGEPAE